MGRHSNGDALSRGRLTRGTAAATAVVRDISPPRMLGPRPVTGCGRAARRAAEGKTSREIRRCLTRHVARQLFKLLESSVAA